MNRLTEFLQNDTGRFSAMRLVFLLWSVGILGMWGYCNVQDKKMIEIPSTVVTAFATIAGWKTVQAWTEKPKTTEPPKV